MRFIATFLTDNKCGAYQLTTTAAGSPGATNLTLSGKLPAGVTFHDNGAGTATLSGCVKGNPSRKRYSLAITATNAVGQTPQSYTLLVKRPARVSLPKKLPPSDGVLGGVPAHTTGLQVMQLTGSGFAPGAPITIGYYADRVTIKTVSASSTGSFATTILVRVTGSHTFVAAGIGRNGTQRFLEAATTT